MVKRLALGLVLIIIALGIIIITLNILDIDEDYRPLLPIPLLNTVFIFAIAVLVAYIVARCYIFTGSPVLVALGSATLAFGAGSLFKGWMTGLGLDVIITVDESTALIASVLHLVAASIGISQQRIFDLQCSKKSRIIFSYYLGVIACVAVVVFLVLHGIIPSFVMPGETSSVLRATVIGITAVFFLVAAFTNVITYYRSRTDFYYWYSLGLMLFGLGVFFISQGAVESRVAWLGRIAQYFGGIYILVSVLSSYRVIKTK